MKDNSLSNSNIFVGWDGYFVWDKDHYVKFEEKQLSNIKDAEELSTTPIIKTIPKLKLITGGKGPIDPPGHDWVQDLEVGTIFLAKLRKMDTFELTQYKLLYKFTKCALVRASLPEREINFYIESKTFSKEVELIEVIGIETEEGIAENE